MQLVWFPSLWNTLIYTNFWASTTFTSCQTPGQVESWGGSRMQSSRARNSFSTALGTLKKCASRKCNWQRVASPVTAFIKSIAYWNSIKSNVNGFQNELECDVWRFVHSFSCPPEEVREGSIPRTRNTSGFCRNPLYSSIGSTPRREQARSEM